MAALPVEVLLGVYLGILTGILPAIVAWSLGFIFKYFTGVSIPALAVVVLGLAIAGANGGMLALIDPTVTTSPNAPTLIVAILIVMMMSVYAHSQGDKLGGTVPHRISFKKLRDRTLSEDVVDLVGGRGKVRITVVGEVGDIEGYPPLPAELRYEISQAQWTFPADLPISELENRVAENLRTEFELTDVTVEIDEEGRATIAAVPPTSGVSKRIPDGYRGVSINAFVPTGLARGDEVSVLADEEWVNGTVVSFRSSLPGSPSGISANGQTDGGISEDGTTEVARESQAQWATSGNGRVTLSVRRNDIERLLGSERGHLVVRARGKRREYELLAMLRRAGQRFKKVTIGSESEFAGMTIGEAAVRDSFGVAILAVRHDDGWILAPRGSTSLEVDNELFVVGTQENLDSMEAVVP